MANATIESQIVDILEGYRDGSYGDVYECANKIASLQTPSNEKYAIGFAEWLMENNYKWEIDDLVGYCWYEENESGESKLYAAADLYNIYKQSTPIPIQTPCVELEKEVERLKGLIGQFKELRTFFKKGSPLTEMMDKIINNL